MGKGSDEAHAPKFFSKFRRHHQRPGSSGAGIVRAWPWRRTRPLRIGNYCAAGPAPPVTAGPSAEFRAVQWGGRADHNKDGGIAGRKIEFGCSR